MIFRVAWLQDALDELARAWIEGDGQQRVAITAAVEAIDRVLQVDPESQGESRSGNRRILLQPPLGVVYEIVPRSASVTVVHVWTFRRRS